MGNGHDRDYNHSKCARLAELPESVQGDNLHEELRQVLPVGSPSSAEVAFSTIKSRKAPMTAEAYLASVRGEAASLPDVLVAGDMPDVSVADGARRPCFLGVDSTIVQPPRCFIPPGPWSSSLLAAFARLQGKLQVVEARATSSHPPTPNTNDESAWMLVCWSPESASPTITCLAQLDHVCVVSVLEMIDEWLRPIHAEDVEVKHGDIAGGQNNSASFIFGGNRRYWLFGFLALLRKYLQFSKQPAAIVLFD